MLNKRLVAGIHAVIILACVILLERDFDYTALFIIIIGLGVLLICYIVSRAIKLRYIPKFDVLIAFCCVVIWIALFYTTPAWSRLTHWGPIVYIIFGFVALVFLVCLLFTNLVVFIIKLFKSKRG